MAERLLPRSAKRTTRTYTLEGQRVRRIITTTGKIEWYDADGGRWKQIHDDDKKGQLEQLLYESKLLKE